MLKALYTAATGMDAQQVRIDSISNNLSNINTSGYKSSVAAFEDLIYDQIKTPGQKNGQNTVAPVGIQIGHGAKLVSVFKHFTQGDFTQTDRELDVAIEGRGFFEVLTDGGDKAYTRAGVFQINSTGALVTSQGYVVQPQITVPTEATSVSIARDGTVSAVISSQSTPQELGTLQVSTFQNASGMKALGQNLYSETDASGTATALTPGQTGAGTLLQGFLENSNVNVAQELINMIVAQRSYEANSRVLSSVNEMMRSANNIS